MKRNATPTPETIADLTLDDRNARRRGPRAEGMLVASLQEVGAARSIVIDEAGRILAGNGTVQAAAEAGIERVNVVDADGETIVAVRRTGLTEAQKRRLALLDNRTAELAEWDTEVLAALAQDGTELNDLWAQDELEALLADAATPASAEQTRATLAEQFMVPPFSVLNARDGWWQTRKRAWIALGIKSELGRGDGVTWGTSPEVNAEGLNYYRNRNGLLGFSEQARTHYRTEGNASEQTGTSIFDPVLCEIAYRWFCPPNGQVVDPFAGGSVRGILAAMLGRVYWGVDLSESQVAANVEQHASICPEAGVTWVVGDSRERMTDAPECDMVFTCPPYADLERYSDDPRDLSTMEYAAFREAYADILAKAASKLHDDRFAVIVVGEARGKDGAYYGFVPDTVQACEHAGLRFYNEAILVTAVGSLPVRAGKPFKAARKLGKTHQNVLVFVKGDARKATQACGNVDVNVGSPDTEYDEV